MKGFGKPGPVFKIVLKQLEKTVIYKILILTKCKMYIFSCTLSSEHPVCKYTNLISAVDFGCVVLQCGRVSSLENLKSLNKILFKLLFT